MSPQVVGCFLFKRGVLLPGEVRPPAAQDVFLQLAGGRLWQLGQEREALRDFEMSEVVAGKLTQLRLVRVGTRPEDDEGMRRFTPFLVRQSDDCDFLHRWMPE